MDAASSLTYFFSIIIIFAAIVLLCYSVVTRLRIKQPKVRLTVYMISTIILAVFLLVGAYTAMLFRQRSDIFALKIIDAVVTDVNVRNEGSDGTTDLKIYSGLEFDFKGESVQTELKTDYHEKGDIIKIYVYDKDNVFDLSLVKKSIVGFDLICLILFLFCLGMTIVLKRSKKNSKSHHHHRHKHHQHHHRMDDAENHDADNHSEAHKASHHHVDHHSREHGHRTHRST